MGMAIDSNKILSKAKRVGTKKTYSFTVDENIGEEFRKICDAEGVSYSSVAEEIIEDFNDSYKKKKEK